MDRFLDEPIGHYVSAGAGDILRIPIYDIRGNYPSKVVEVLVKDVGLDTKSWINVNLSQVYVKNIMQILANRQKELLDDTEEIYEYYDVFGVRQYGIKLWADKDKTHLSYQAMGYPTYRKALEKIIEVSKDFKD